LSFMDIIGLKAANMPWPVFTKPTDPRKVTALRLCNDFTMPDKYSAALAYACSIDLGESSAACAAGRWLGIKERHASITFELRIRGALRRVSDEDKKLPEAILYPPYMVKTLDYTELKVKEIGKWEMGRTNENFEVFDLLASRIVGLEGSFLIVGHGGRSMGFDEGDYDFVVASRDGMQDIRHVCEVLRGATRSGDGTLVETRFGKILKLDDVEIGGKVVAADIVFPREGYPFINHIGRKTLFWQLVLSTEDTFDIKDFFEEIRLRARRSGLIDSCHGYLNMWSFMVQGMSYMARKGGVAVNPMVPLLKQTPSVRNSMSSVKEMVADMLCEFAVLLKDPNVVLGDFGLSPAPVLRSKSEFKTASYTRVMRDPFSYVGDNPLRTLSPQNVKTCCTLLEHIAACREHVHCKKDFDITKDITERDNIHTLFNVPTINIEDIPGVIYERCEGMWIGLILELGSFGIGKSEEDAYGRAIMNANIGYDRITITTGPALTSECGKEKGITGEWVISRRDSIFCNIYRENGIFYAEFGSCPADSWEEKTLHRADYSEIELLLGGVYQEGHYRRKLSREEEKVNHLKLSGIGVQVFPTKDSLK